ncbi:MAG: hypothetical protein V2I97_07455 [Desulfococcaceae bacterium]|jgi:hypothetical protein|nr:hypothetical protein [Desulfococcaceae bacterium]
MIRLYSRMLCAFVSVLCTCMTAFAETGSIATDGSAGPAVNLSGPEYEIAADLGKQAGGNLFHSFGKFGPDSSE